MRNCSHKVSTVIALLTAIATTAFAAKESKIETQVETRVVKVKAPIRYEFSRTVRKGRLVKAQDGREGVIKKTFRITYKDGKPVDKELLKEERREAEPTLFLMSRSGFQTSRGGFGRGRVLSMVATGYHSMVTGTGRTRMGMRADYGHVAVDPRVIPLGSLVYVEGYGMAIASDTGGAIKGNRIDLCFPDYGTAARYGHKRLKVHVLGRR
jgi:3D (Asp-Asp-Asp) domain-containing protein